MFDLILQLWQKVLRGYEQVTIYMRYMTIFHSDHSYINENSLFVTIKIIRQLYIKPNITNRSW